MTFVCLASPVCNNIFQFICFCIHKSRRTSRFHRYSFYQLVSIIRGTTVISLRCTVLQRVVNSQWRASFVHVQGNFLDLRFFSLDNFTARDLWTWHCREETKVIPYALELDTAAQYRASQHVGLLLFWQPPSVSSFRGGAIYSSLLKEASLSNKIIFHDFVFIAHVWEVCRCRVGYGL